MGHAARVAVVRDHRGQLICNAEPPIPVREQHDAAVRGDASAIEGGADLLASYRWWVEGPGYIFVHGEFVAPQSRPLRSGKEAFLTFAD
jgi:hypothetical protein